MELQWKQLVQALKKTGEDIRVEAERLVDDVRESANQEAVKQKLQGLGEWAKKTVEEGAVAVEAGFRKLESALRPQAAPKRKVAPRKKAATAARKATQKAPKKAAPKKRKKGA